MSKKEVKKFFSNEKRVSKIIFSAVMVVVVSLVLGNGVFAYFKRTAVDSNFNYGYGYGYDGTTYGYGYGYGYGANISNNENYGFWGADGAASSLSAAAAGTTGLTISYSTSYLAKNKVYYGTTNTGTCSTLASASSQTGFQSGSNSITVTDLTCATTYYYCVASEDVGGTAWYTSIYSKGTAACSGGGGGGAVVTTPTTPTEVVPETRTTSADVTAAEGGTVTHESSEGSSVEITFPGGAVSSDVSVSVESAAASTLETAGTVGSVPTALYRVGNLVFQISAADSQGNAVSEFSKAVSLKFNYTDSQVQGLDENSLKVYKWNGSAWLALESTVDTQNNTVTVNVSEFSYFAIMGEKAEQAAEEEAPTTISAIKDKIKEIIKQLITLISQLIEKLQKQLEQLEGVNTITTDLKYGMTSDEVKLLQIWLAKDSQVYPEAVISGWFGSLTMKAVKRFQEKYAAEILTPYGLTEATGFVGSATRAKLNELYGQ